MSNWKVGVIGYGEAGRAFATGLASRSHPVSVYDARPIAGVPEGVLPVDSLEEMAGEAGLVLSCVWPGAAREVAAEIAPWLDASHIYCDMNNVSPQTTITMREIVESTGASFLKGAVMSPIAEMGARVPVMLGGRDALSMAGELQAMGIDASFCSTEPEVPAAIKILRSILLKGIVALAYEAYWAGEEYGAGRQILESGFAALTRRDVRVTVEDWMNSSLIHARRRAQELGEAAVTVEEAGLPPIMSKAAEALLEELADRVAAAGYVPAAFTEL